MAYRQKNIELMKKIKKYSNQSIGFTIVSSTIIMIVILVASIFVSNYINYFQNIKESTNVQTQEISRQIVYNYENYIGTIIETSNLIQVDIANRNIEEEPVAISEYFSDIIRLKSEIIRIDIYDEDGKNITSSEKSEINTSLRTQENWLVWALQEPTIHNFSVPYEEYGTYRLTISKYIDFNRNSEHGILKIEINFNNIIELAKNSNLGVGGYISIIDANYNKIYSSKSPTSNLSNEDEETVLKSIVLGSQSTKIGDYEMMIHVDTLENTKWRICVFTNIDQIMMIQRDFLRNIILISAVFIIVAVVVLLGISRKITRPLEQLEQAMTNVDNNDYFMIEEVNLTANKEVESLSIRFNLMMKRIKELMDKVVVEQNEQRKSELKALHNQINPHFLYNTLDSITWLIEKNKNYEASEMVVALAKFFRISIYKGLNIIPIRDEIEHARNYLLIQSFRYQDTFDYEFIVDEKLLNKQTMKLVLQPIIENSIYHGLKNQIDPGHLIIKVEQVDDNIKFSVIDNGYGMRQEKIDDLYKNLKNPNLIDGVGLKNIYQRLAIYYGIDAKLIIESELDEGTCISVIIPIVNVTGDLL